MSAIAVAMHEKPALIGRDNWIYNRRWDLAFISLSVVLVPLPYLIWILFRDVLQVESDAGRQVVNLVIAALIGGPHMYATFTRTTLDQDFRRDYSGLVRSSLVIPLIVVALALTNLTLLLTIFFFWASIHVLHQIVFVVDAYNRRSGEPDLLHIHQTRPKAALPAWLRYLDYAVVCTSLAPIAAYRIAITQDFSIGPSRLNDIIPSLFEQPWLFYLASAAFAVALTGFVAKTVLEVRAGRVHWPKTIFISVTVVASFIAPALGNLDTSFQGLNVWHSFQYLALTWYINRLRIEKGELKHKPFLQRLSADGRSRLYYGFNLALTLGSGLVIGLVFLILNTIGGKWVAPAYALETAYYIGVLSVLWVHYYHDHFLFTQSDAVLL